MAEQCIVCLETLLHAAEPPPQQPPPLPDDAATGAHSASSSSASASSASSSSTAASTSASAPSSTDGRPSTAPAAPKPADDAADGAAAAPGDHDDNHVAVIQICGHTLHDFCLREWSTKANSCPICRQSFHLVDVYDKIGGTLLSTYTVEDKKQVAEFDPQAWLDEFPEVEDDEDEVTTPCPVCNLADHEEVLLLCDGCDTPYHTHCIGLESVPEGAWFCMECVDLFGEAVHAPASRSLRAAAAWAATGSGAAATTVASGRAAAGRRAAAAGAAADASGRRSGASRARNDFFPRTRYTMRRARRRARSDEWQGAWGQITGRIWDALNIDLDHDEDEALEEYRRVERLRDNERREFERWQERLDIARRLGAQDVFERNIPSAILHHASRHAGGGGNASPQSSASAANPRAQVAAVRQSQEERRAWGDLERARECDQATTATPAAATRKRKSRSITASPVEPPPEPERKLKRPRTRRIGAPSEPVPSSSRSPSSRVVPVAAPATAAAAAAAVAAADPQAPPAAQPSTFLSTSAAAPAASASTPASTSAAVSASTSATSNATANSAPAPAPTAGPSAATSASPPANGGEPPSFLSSLLKEVEMSTPSDDENIRCLFGDPPLPPLQLSGVDPSSPAGSSPTASAYNSPRAMSTTPPPLPAQAQGQAQRALRPSSPTLLSSHILPVYPPANYSPGRPAAGQNGGVGSGGENSDSESNNTNGVHPHPRPHQHQHRSPSAVEIRHPRPRRMPAAAAAAASSPTGQRPRSQDASPTRHALSLEMKESISSIVRSALNPHWKSSQLTADQYAAINRDVSRKLYEEVTNPAAVDTEARKLWEQKANREVARAVADLHV